MTKKFLKQIFTFICIFAIIAATNMIPVRAADEVSGDAYPKTLTFVKDNGQEVNVTFNDETQELTNQGERWVKGFFTKSYFQGWSDKESITEPGAKIWFANTKIGEIVSEDGSTPTKLYSIYMGPTESEKAMSPNNSNNSIEINRNMDGSETLSEDAVIIASEGFDRENPTDAVKTVDAKYEKGKDFYDLEVNSRFTMDKSIALVTFLNGSSASGGDDGARVLTIQYSSTKPGSNSRGPVFDEWFSKAAPVDENGKPMTYVDLVVNLDERITVPDELTVNFKSYNFQPYYVLTGDKTKVLRNFNPDSVQDSPVTAGNPDTQITFPTEGQHSFVLRTGIRNKAYYYTDPKGNQEHWRYTFTIVNPEGSPAPKAPGEKQEKLATYLNAEEAQNIFNDVELNVASGQLKISNAVAKEIADGNAERVVIAGHIEVQAVMSTKAIKFGPVAFNAANLNIGFIKRLTVTFDENYQGKGDDKTVEVEVAKSIDGDTLTGDGHDMVSNPTRKGYKFLGWNSKPNGSGESFDKDTVVNEDRVVYAQWEKKKDPNPNPVDPGVNPPKPDPGNPDINPPKPNPSNPGGNTPSPQNTSKDGVTNTGMPKTGDGTQLMEFAMLALLSVALLGLVERKVRKSNK